MPAHRPGPAPDQATRPWPVLTAPSTWRHIDIISDLHLQPGEPATLALWQHALQTSDADALFILGDLFEVWVGDDVLTPSALPNAPPLFEALCAQTLHATSQRLPVFFMHGNRDFLLGDQAAQACGMTLLSDPTVLVFGAQRWLLSHGDALCLDDTEYMQFRTQVRSAQWQQQFLQQPLPERLALARALRASSEARKQSGAAYADVDTPAALAWLDHAQADTLIHGHTHHPKDHPLAPQRQRVVLSDWDASAVPARAEVLRLSRHPDQSVTLKRTRLAPLDR